MTKAGLKEYSGTDYHNFIVKLSHYRLGDLEGSILDLFYNSFLTTWDGGRTAYLLILELSLKSC